MAIITSEGVFITTPRCGSNYLRKFFSSRNIKHSNLRVSGYSVGHPPYEQIKESLPKCVQVYSLCRNNISWYKSVWGLQKSTNWKVWEDGLIHPFREIENIKEDCYEVWRERVREKNPNFWEDVMKMYGCEERSVITINLINLTQVIGDMFCVPHMHEHINETNYKEFE